MPNSKSGVLHECIVCHYKCSRLCDYTRHLSTDKHKILTNPNLKSVKSVKNIIQCECGKIYKHKSTLSAHKKICKNKNFETNTNNLVNLLIEENKNLKEFMIEQHNEFKNLIVDICKNTSNITNINNNNNINNISNKTFNLNIFLNEECKDAMNIMDFVNSLKLQLCDLENVGKLGFVEGISNIIIKNLKALEMNKRPVHCSDFKREVLYIKDENKWEKENSEKDKLRKAIKFIAHKNTKLLSEFKDKYPDCVYSDSKKSDQYNNLIIESMGGRGDNDLEKENKIIKNIAKEVIINK